MAFAPDYVHLVLREIFDDAVSGLLEPLMAVHEAHLVMLSEQGILARPDAARLAVALQALDLDAVRSARFDGADEDLFFHVERRLADACGPDVAGRLHTARSRNDIDMAMYRLRLRRMLRDVLSATLDLRQVLLVTARRHTSTIFAAHTHAQPAQPTTLAHYLHAVIEQLERDAGRIERAIATTNRCPLGACAITGTGFPIDRMRTSDLLGFDGPTGNTYGSIATVDYLLDAAGVTVTAVVGCGRVTQDLLLWSTAEVGYLSLADGFVQVSSIMPQKRNPVALEHARALLSKACGQLQAVTTMVHNTPFGDIVDSEDDLQPLVARGFVDARRALRLLACALDGATFHTDRMARSASANWVTATELADALTRDYGVPFAVAHRVVSRVVRSSGPDPSQAFARFRDALADAGLAVAMSVDEFNRILSPRHFVDVRETSGGPGPAAMAAALDASTAALDRDRERCREIEARWRTADVGRREAVRAQGTMT